MWIYCRLGWSSTGGSKTGKSGKELTISWKKLDCPLDVMHRLVREATTKYCLVVKKNVWHLPQKYEMKVTKNESLFQNKLQNWCLCIVYVIVLFVVTHGSENFISRRTNDRSGFPFRECPRFSINGICASRTNRFVHDSSTELSYFRHFSSHYSRRRWTNRFCRDQGTSIEIFLQVLKPFCLFFFLHFSRAFKMVFLCIKRLMWFEKKKFTNFIRNRQGHECPTNYNPADFLVATLAIAPREEDSSRRTAQRICDAFLTSDACREMDVILQLELHMASSYDVKFKQFSKNPEQFKNEITFFLFYLNFFQWRGDIRNLSNL